MKLSKYLNVGRVAILMIAMTSMLALPGLAQAQNALILPQVPAEQCVTGKFELNVANTVEVSAGQVQFSYDSTTGFEVTGVERGARTGGQDCKDPSQPNDAVCYDFEYSIDKTDPADARVFVLFYTASSTRPRINPGSGPILTFTYQMPSGEAGATPLMLITDDPADPDKVTLLSDRDAQNIPFTPVNGGVSWSDGAMAFIPNVVEKSQTEAEASILTSPFTLGNITNANDNTVPAGSVISQNPAAWSYLSPCTAIDLVISLGPAMTEVPNVVGLPMTQAGPALGAAGLQPAPITFEYSDQPQNTVLSQDPPAGTEVLPGTRVALVLSQGPEPDCNGDPGGTAYIDNCNICVEGNTGQTACEADCNGDWGGTAVTDNCGICVEGNTGQTACEADCNGDWGGTAVTDNCNICVEGNTGQTACEADC
ncbi:MAG: PASTA domain-containing protein, partial [Desulfobulbaceae bacterium]|nr:PASTA domain-containing protein [Desulfobulbaceae bacterium]